jgi:hypothetical protein
VDIYYPFEYSLFTIGVILAVFLGCLISLHFFSPKRIRLIPVGFLLAYYWFSHNLIVIALTVPMVLLYFLLSIDHALISYRFVPRKERTKERMMARSRGILWALFHREVTILWRDRLLFSFVFTSITTALGTGYFILYGADILVPESIRAMVEGFLPSLFVFLGVYIVIIYTAVFPGLNLFLNEEKTMWILQNLPLEHRVIVTGKTLTLALCFLTTLPFLADIVLFVGVDQLMFLLWFLMFSFLAGVIVSVPLGAKYVGKKSDVLLLYSIAMLLLVVMGFAATGVMQLTRMVAHDFVLYLLLLGFELCLLWFSLRLSSYLLGVQVKKTI